MAEVTAGGDRGRMSPRKREILRAAARLFHEKGYTACSIQDVADEVGILKGSLYYYIDSKEDLLFDIVEDVHRESLANLERWQRIEGTALVKLRAFIEGHVQSNVNNLIGIGVFFQDFRSLSPERRAQIIEKRDVYDRFLRQLISQGQREGVIDEQVNVKLAAMALLGMMNWLYQWYRLDGQSDPAAVAREFADLALSGLAVREDQPRQAIGALPEGFERVVEDGPSSG